MLNSAIGKMLMQSSNDTVIPFTGFTNSFHFIDQVDKRDYVRDVAHCDFAFAVSGQFFGEYFFSDVEILEPFGGTFPVCLLSDIFLNSLHSPDPVVLLSNLLDGIDAAFEVLSDAG